MAWTGDTCGQGYGRNPDFGGLVGYKAMREAQPALWVHSGDMIYADNPILPAQTLADGRVWRNVSNERVARVAESLDDFRARFAYNLEDSCVAALAAEVPILAQWDDHETHNNWWPGQQLDDDRYTIERDASKLSAFARQAMLEWTPTPAGPVNRVIHYGPLLDVIVLDCRSFRSPNDTGAGPHMLGDAQVRWFVEALRASRARWRIIACDQPIGLFITDGPNNDRIEGFANGTAALVGRERELAFILPSAPKNTIWVTTDVHHAQATRYSGNTYAPFWEFIAGPIHAGSFQPPVLDPTFGPEVKFQWGPEHQNMAPWDGLANFGTVDVTRDALTVKIIAVDGKARYSVDLPYVG
jgi:alkaline phosphatase D